MTLMPSLVPIAAASPRPLFFMVLGNYRLSKTEKNIWRLEAQREALERNAALMVGAQQSR